MSEKKVLIVAYYWPPSGGSGVQRWLKFVKYLPSFGWKPYVLTPANPTFEAKDETLLKDIPSEAEVITLPIWEPYNFFISLSKIFSGKKVKSMDFINTGKKSLFQKITTFIRGNFFIPDPKIFWVRPAAKYLSGYMKKHNIDTFVTTGPPHSLHLIGLRLKKKNSALKWIADFRDPWSEWDIYDHLMLTKFSKNHHKTLEQNVLVNADRVITISPFHVDRLEQLGGRKVDLITNGFDDDDFKNVVHKRTEKFVIRHLGVVDELRDPKPFLNVIAELANQNKSFSEDVLIEFIGNVNSALVEFIEKHPILLKLVRFKKPVTHAEIISVYGETDVLLLILARTVIAPGNLPGKMFEYMASGKPILCIGPERGDAADIINSTGIGVVVEMENHDSIYRELEGLYSGWKNNELKPRKGATVYSRRNLTEKLTVVLELKQ